MTRAEYLAALSRALADLPDDTTASVIADYEKRFDAAIASGQSEPEVARSMPNPGVVASTYWSTARGTSNQSRFDVAAFTSAMPVPTAVARPKGGVRPGQLTVTALGLALLNFFMLIPAFVLASMLAAMLPVALAIYGGGIVVTAAAVAGVDNLVFDPPFRITGDGELLPGLRDASAGISEVTILPAEVQVVSQDRSGRQTLAIGHSRMELMTLDGNASRPLQAAKGCGAIFGGIALMLAWLVLIKLTWHGLRRYVGLNISALKTSWRP